MPIKLQQISLPTYLLHAPPNFQQAGKALDAFIREQYSEQEVLIRCISSANHRGKSVKELINIIRKQGTDKYDLSYRSFWEDWEEYRGANFDIFASRKVVDKDFSFGEKVLELFYEGALADRGYRVIIDILLIYDIIKFEMVPIFFSNSEVEETWKFKEQEKKTDALLGIIEIIP